MNRRRLAKIQLQLAEIQRSPRGRKPSEFERLAKRLGRRKVKRGSEPNYASPDIPKLGPPLSIPHHAELKIGTSLSILTTLQSDVDVWAQHLDQLDSDGMDTPAVDDDSEDVAQIDCD